MKKIMQILGLVIMGNHFLFSGDVTITGNILPSAVVGFSKVNTELLGTETQGDGIFKSTTIDLGSTELNADSISVENKFYVRSNNPNGVQIKITPQEGEAINGALTGPNDEQITLTYILGGYTPYETVQELLPVSNISTPI